MIVQNIGDVTSCNEKYCFYKLDGNNNRISMTKEIAKTILEVAKENSKLYSKMYDILQADYDSDFKKAKATCCYITDDDARKDWTMSLIQESNNRKCDEQYFMAFGIATEKSRIVKRLDEALCLKSACEHILRGEM